MTREIYFQKLILAEFEDATQKFGKFNSKHEGYAIIKEELDELWDAIKKNELQEQIRREAIQIAAMALRFLYDLC